MKRSIVVLVLMALSTVALADLSGFTVTSGNVTAKFTESQVAKMLGEGRTCVKDGVKVLFKSKDLTKKHCQKSTILGLRVIKAKNLELELYKKITGLK